MAQPLPWRLTGHGVPGTVLIGIRSKREERNFVFIFSYLLLNTRNPRLAVFVTMGMLPDLPSSMQNFEPSL